MEALTARGEAGAGALRSWPYRSQLTRIRSKAADVVVSRLILLALSSVALAACRESVSSEGTITVSGAVVDEYLRPQAGVGVQIAGRPLVLTNDNGHFSISQVRAPYDLVTGLTSDRAGLVYAGLTRTDPLVVVPPSPFLSPFRGATTWGDVTGGLGLPEPANHRTSVLFESAETRWPGSVSGGSRYMLEPRWLGAETTVGTLHALQWQFDPATGFPVTYTGHGSTPLTIPNGGYFQGPLVNMTTPVPAGSISGAITVPTGFGVATNTLHAGFGTSSHPPAWRILIDSSGASSFTYITPNVAGATFTLTARAAAGPAYTDVVRTGISANATGVTLNIPAPPALLAPAPGATGVDGRTEYSWSRMTGAVYLLSIRYSGSVSYLPPPTNYYIFTTDTVARIPNLTEFGLFSPLGSAYVWEVRAWAPIASVDAVASPTWFLPQSDPITAVSAPRQFTFTR